MIINDAFDLRTLSPVNALLVSESYSRPLVPQVLQSLQYVDDGGAVQLKGRVACQISSHELLLTELLFENVLSPLAPEESAALLSCLIFAQNTQVEPHLTSTLKEVRRTQNPTADPVV